MFCKWCFVSSLSCIQLVDIGYWDCAWWQNTLGQKSIVTSGHLGYFQTNTIRVTILHEMQLVSVAALA